jgi:hypothetical protein
MPTQFNRINAEKGEGEHDENCLAEMGPERRSKCRQRESDKDPMPPL